MATSAAILARAVLTDVTGAEQQRASLTATIADVVGENGKRETVTLGASFSSLSPPSGASAVLIHVVSGAVTLTLKGITADTGVVLSSAALAAVPLLLPLGSSPSIGILSDGVAVLDVLWM